MGDVAVESSAPEAAPIPAEAPPTKQAEIAQEAAPKDPSPEPSEYDSAGSYSDAEQADDAKSEHSDTEGSVGLEREEGDGQESAPLRKVDDDEDKKNPQYIPKKGTFYEHDDRTADDIEQEAVVEEEEKDKDGKKKLWQDKKERWSHDRFNDTEQAPKSRTELIAIYGYDIRNEEGPPKARRRRRYGRGPNKYTRNWEDEDAYVKAAPRPVKKPPLGPNRPPRDGDPARGGGRRRSSEEFPPLEGGGGSHSNNSNDRDSSERQLIDHHREETNGNNSSVNQNLSSLEFTRSNNASNQSNPNTEYGAHKPQNQQQQQRVGSGRVIKPKKEIKDSDYRGFTSKTRQVRKDLRNRDEFIQSQNFTNKNNNVQDIERDLGHMNIQDQGYEKGPGKPQNSQRQGSVPPRLQSEQKGSKRYSSMRQRSLPETGTPPNYNTGNYYPNEYNQQQPQQQQVPIPVTNAPLMQAPPYAPPPFAQAPPPFLQPGVAPPQFIPQPPPQQLNYVAQGQGPFPPPNFQGYQPPYSGTAPPELYQPQGGITYYSADQQQMAQRAVPQKRPKAAIPIVAPPDSDKSRGRKEDLPELGADLSVEKCAEVQ